MTKANITGFIAAVALWAFIFAVYGFAGIVAP